MPNYYDYVKSVFGMAVLHGRTSMRFVDGTIFRRFQLHTLMGLRKFFRLNDDGDESMFALMFQQIAQRRTEKSDGNGTESGKKRNIHNT